MIKQVGCKYEWTYPQCPTDEKGWIEHKDYRPSPFDMTLVKVKRAGKLIGTSYSAWWTGKSWEGRKLKEEDQVVLWKKSPEGK